MKCLKEKCIHHDVCALYTFSGYASDECGFYETRPHGEWKVYSHCSDGFEYKCSLCGRVVNEGHWFEQKEILSVYPYCHCGAKMVAVEDPIKWYFGLGKKESELDFKCIKVGNTIYTQDNDKQGWTGKEEE